MGTSRTFSTMLNEYLPNSLLKEEILKRDWLLSNVEKDNAWLGGNLVVPFKAAGASSVAFGSLTADTDVSEDNYVRGEITSQPEVWGTMIFNHRDLMEHNKVSEQNFLKILPDTVEDFISKMKMAVSLAFTNGTSFAKVTDATNAATGILIVDRVERFEIGQKVTLIDGNTAAADYYVTAINSNTDAITVSATRGGGAANVSAYSVAQEAKFYWDGSDDAGAGLTSLKASLLPATVTGGSSTLYGQTKTAYPYLQAIVGSGASMTSVNVLEVIFDHYVKVRVKGKGDPTTVLMSYKHFGSVLKALESAKGAYHQDQKGTSVSVYGWQEVQIFGPAGKLKIVAIQEMDDDWMAFLDTRPNVMKIYSNGFFKKRASPEGKEYFEKRATTGYSYLVDVCFFGDFVLQRPSYCGALHTISY